MEKIRSGQSFLYRENGLNSTVLDIRMKDNIRGDYIQRALTTAIKRYPYISSKLVEKNGDFYLEQSPISMNTINTKKLRRLGSMSTGYHLVDVTYSGKQVYISFHHALCDGRGITPFLETLIYYYCCYRYNKKFDSSGIGLEDEELLPDETTEPLGNSFFEVDESRLPQVLKDGYALPEHADDQGNYYRYEIKMKRSSFVKCMKSCEATPAILLAMMVSSSIYEAHPNADKPIVCSMAVDYRREIGLLNTHKNCVGSLYLPYSSDYSTRDLSEIAQLYRRLMKEQRQPDSIKNLINAQIGLCAKLDSIPTLEGKRQALSFFNDMRIDSYVISSLGQIKLNDYEEYVDSIHLYNSGVKGLRINMVCAGDYFTVDFLQCFESEEIITALKKTLETMRIEYIASERIQFETVKDKAFITASNQAERYYK